MAVERGLRNFQTLAYLINRVEGGGLRLHLFRARCISSHYQAFLLENLDHLGGYHGGELVCYVEVISHIGCKITTGSDTGLGAFFDSL
jgi:hypothetical protein